MNDNKFDPIEFAIRLRKARLSGDTSDVINYAKDLLKQPATNSTGYGTQVLDPTQLNTYIHDMISQSFNQSLSMFGQMFGRANSDIVNPVQTNAYATKDEDSSKDSPEVFETHDSIIVRLTVPSNISPRSVKVRTSSSRIFIKLGPYMQEEIIQLPEDVRKDEAKAVIRNHILEVTIPKESGLNLQDIQIEHQ